MPSLYKPVTCLGGNHPVGTGRTDWCADCDPVTCTCNTPRPDGIGECAGCHRLVLTHSWHDGRPGAPVEQKEAC